MHKHIAFLGTSIEYMVNWVEKNYPEVKMNRASARGTLVLKDEEIPFVIVTREEQVMGLQLRFWIEVQMVDSRLKDICRVNMR